MPPLTQPLPKVGSVRRSGLFTGHEVLVLRVTASHVEAVEAYGSKMVYIWLPHEEFLNQYPVVEHNAWLKEKRT